MQKIEFIDLKAQQARIRAGLDRRLARVLDQGNYILGPEVAELEALLAKYSGTAHCISCANGTDALLMVLMAHGVGAGDAIFVPAFTFFATAEVVALAGAIPVFVDVDAATFNLDPDDLQERIAGLEARHPGARPRGVIPVDLFGQAADYDKIGAIAARHNLFVLEDAAQSFGAEVNGRRACALAEYATTSFFPAKPLGCYGDGGAIFCGDGEFAGKLRSIRVHGMGSHKYENVRIGLNGRLDTLQAAILLEKMSIFDDEVRARNEVAGRYTAGLSGTLQTPRLRPGYSSVWAQYSVLCDDRDERVKRLAAAGVPTAIYYPMPLHLQKAFAHLGYRAGDFPSAESLSRRIFSLPMHAYLSRETQEYIIQECRK